MGLSFAVTGGTGFVGRYVINEALLAGHQITLLSRERPSNAFFAGPFEHIPFDLEGPLPSFADIGKPDRLLHLAWEGVPNYRSLNHFESVSKHYKFLRHQVKTGLRQITVTGTCLEYGLQEGELVEDMENYPAIPYGFGKDVLRRQLQFLQRENDFTLVWARLFYMWGDGQGPNSLYSQIQKALKHKDRLFRMSAGQQVRDFLPIADIARLVVQLAEHQRDLGIVNVCSGKPTTVEAQVKMWLTDMNKSLELDLGYYSYPDYEPMRFWGSTGKLRSLIA